MILATMLRRNTDAFPHNIKLTASKILKKEYFVVSLHPNLANNFVAIGANRLPIAIAYVKYTIPSAPIFKTLSATKILSIS